MVDGPSLSMKTFKIEFMHVTPILQRMQQLSGLPKVTS